MIVFYILVRNDVLLLKKRSENVDLISAGEAKMKTSSPAHVRRVALFDSSKP